MTDKQMKGIGGAPTRATTLPTTSQGRKECPVASGVLDYFPDAIAAVARVSFKSNDQHNAGKPLHWNRSTSHDEADALMRHFLQRGLLDEDGLSHSAKMAWRALALLQKELENRPFSVDLRDVPVAPEGAGSQHGFTTHGIKDGPYCCNCDRLAEFRSTTTENYWCGSCLDGDRFDMSAFTVMERA